MDVCRSLGLILGVPLRAGLSIPIFFAAAGQVCSQWRITAAAKKDIHYYPSRKPLDGVGGGRMKLDRVGFACGIGRAEACKPDEAIPE